jgi:hypothetical protein
MYTIMSNGRLQILSFVYIELTLSNIVCYSYQHSTTCLSTACCHASAPHSTSNVRTCNPNSPSLMLHIWLLRYLKIWYLTDLRIFFLLPDTSIQVYGYTRHGISFYTSSGSRSEAYMSYSAKELLFQCLCFLLDVAKRIVIL